MIFKKYNTFLESKLITENLEAAKNFLRRRILDEEKQKNPDLNLSISGLEEYGKQLRKDPRTPRNPVADKVLAADKNPYFVKIIQMLGDKLGWANAFVRFHFDLGVPVVELKETLDKIKELPQQDVKLLKNADSYATIVPGADKKTGYEILLDDLAEIEVIRSVANFVRQLPGDFVVKNEYAKDFGQTVPSFRKAAKDATGKAKEQIREISIAFDALGENADEKKSLQRIFMVSCLRYRTLSEVILKAYQYIDAASKKTISDLLITIDKANMDYGFANGAEPVYNEKGVVIFEVKSYQANVLINSATKHCIKDSYSQWENYVSGDSNFNKQYYIWNFNESSASNEFIIGVTVEPNFKIRAAHFKDDKAVDNIKSYVKRKLKIEFEDYFLPMSPSEIDFKKRRIAANKIIIKDDLTLEDAERSINDGADPNLKEGKPLEKAVNTNNIELARFLIEKGAKPTIGKPMRFAKTFDMIALLIKGGAQIEEKTLDNCVKDVIAVKFLLDNGLDVNSREGAPVVSAIKNNAVDSFKLLIENGGEVYLRRWRALKVAMEFGNKEILDIIFEHIKSRKQKIDADDKEEILSHFKERSRLEVTYPDKTAVQLKKIKAELEKFISENLEQI